MNYEQALEWLRGERSLTNIVPEYPRETWLVRIAEADAAATQQAYWIVRAYKEGLVEALRDLLNEALPGERPASGECVESLLILGKDRDRLQAEVERLRGVIQNADTPTYRPHSACFPAASKAASRIGMRSRARVITKKPVPIGSWPGDARPPAEVAPEKKMSVHR